MAEARMKGGLYRNPGGSGFHDAAGRPVELRGIPAELLTEAELESLTAPAPSEEPTETPAAPETQPAATPGLPQDFPGYAELVAANITTLAEVRAHPDLSTIKGIGPRRLREIAEALKG